MLIRELGDLTHGLAGDRQQIGTALDSMSQLSVAMDDLTRRTRQPLTTDIGHINTLGGLVNKQTDILTKGLRGRPEAARRLRPVDELRQLAEHLHLLAQHPHRRDGPHDRRARRRRQHEGVPVRRLTAAGSPGQHRPGGGAGGARRLEAAARRDDLHRRLRQRLGDLERRQRPRGRHRRRQGHRASRLERGVVHVEFTAEKGRGRRPDRAGRDQAGHDPRPALPRPRARQGRPRSTAAAPSRWPGRSRRTRSTSSRSTPTTRCRPSTRRPSRRRSTP